MRRGQILSIVILSLFLFTVATPVALTKTDLPKIARDVTIYQNKIFDNNEDKIDDKFMADITINANYYFDATIKFDHQVTGADLFQIGKLGAFCYDGSWDLGRRVRARVSRDMLDELAELPGITMITSASIRNIFVLAEDGDDLSVFDVLVDNFEGVRIIDVMSIAMVPYYSGVENDIAQLGFYNRIIDVTDIRLEINSGEATGNVINTDDSVSTTAINATGMWSAGFNGTGVKVGIIDTGINSAHNDLAGRIGDAKSFILQIYGYDHDDTTTGDTDGHGSHVAGIAVGDGTNNVAYKGVAPNAFVYMAKVESSATLYSIAEAMNWLVKTKDCEVVNLSFGGTDNPGRDIVEETFRNCVRNYNVSITVAQGNDGLDGWYTAHTPGTTDAVIAVANVDTSSGFPYSMAYTSSRGLTADNHMKPDMGAPGTHIVSLTPTGQDYTTKSGTSMAAPQVAGAIALLIQACKENSIDYNPGVIKAALMQSCTTIDSNIDPLIQGPGIINVGNAWNIIKHSDKYLTIPIIGAINPPRIPYSFWDPIAQGQVAEIYLTIANPFKTNLSLAVTGVAEQFITIGGFADEYTEIVKLTFVIPVDATIGNYAGLVTLYYNGTKVLDTCEIDLNIEESNGHRILSNYRSTYRGDNHIYNGQYVNFVSDLQNMGYAFSEQDVLINGSVLDNYEMVWYPDPYSIDFPNDYKGEYIPAITWNDWTDDEIAALDAFVADGGTVFLDFLGADESNGIDHGTNVTTINRFTEDYGIHVRDDIWPIPSTVMVNTVGTNPLTKDVSYVDHYGCSLELSGDAVMVTEYTPGSPYATCAYTQTASGGRVIVLTTNFLLDTAGYLNNYASGATQNDVFAQNIIRWGSAKNRIQFLNATQVGTDIIVKYRFLKGDDESFSGFALGPTSNTTLVWTEESEDVWVTTLSNIKYNDYYFMVECGQSGQDDYDYFKFSAIHSTTNDIGLISGIVVLIGSLGLASWYFSSKRRKA